MILALPIGVVAAWGALSAVSVTAHSWIDCLGTSRTKLYDRSAEYIYGGAKGNGFCDGYAAGFPGRGVADIGPEFTHKMLKSEVDAGTAVCQSVDPNTYSGWRKRLSVQTGVPVYLSYLENGHVSKDQIGQGTKYGIYWTGQVGSKLSSTKDMTEDKLVDGKLHDFDDGNCGESVDSNGKPTGRAGDGKPCIGEFIIPKGTQPGIYHFVWYWKYYSEDKNGNVDKTKYKGYSGAAYSSCFEVEVTSNDQSKQSDISFNLIAPKPAPTVIRTPAPTRAPTPSPNAVLMALPTSDLTPALTPHMVITPTPAPAAAAPPPPPAPTPVASKYINFTYFTAKQLADAVANAKNAKPTPKPKRKNHGSTYCV